MSKEKLPGAGYPDVKSKYELDRLVHARPKPRPAPMPTPNGPLWRDSQKLNAQEIEDRIKTIRQSLNRKGKDFEHDFAKSSLKGRAKVAFNKER